MAEKRPTRPKVIDFKKEATLDYVRELAARGMYEKDIALCLGYNRTYFSEMKKEHPELSDALKQGAARGLERVTGKLLDNIDAGKEASTFFYLKCKGGWRDNAFGGSDGDASADNGAVSQRVLASVQRTLAARRGERSEDSSD